MPAHSSEQGRIHGRYVLSHRHTRRTRISRGKLAARNHSSARTGMRRTRAIAADSTGTGRFVRHTRIIVTHYGGPEVIGCGLRGESRVFSDGESGFNRSRRATGTWRSKRAHSSASCDCAQGRRAREVSGFDGSKQVTSYAWVAVNFWRDTKASVGTATMLPTKTPRPQF